MAHHEHQHPHHDQHHGHAHTYKRRPIHKHWLTWVVVLLMLGAMAMYVISDDESIRPGGGQGQPMPAAEAPPAGV